MKSLIVKGMVLSAFALAMTNTASAAPSNGVSCPSGTTGSTSNGVLKCFKNKRFVLASVCPPINRPLNIVMNSRHKDKCLPVGAGNPVSSAMAPPGIGFPALSAFHREISNNGVDRFVARVRQYKHPRGKIYTHDPARGVKCPSSYSRAANSTSRKLVCEKVTYRKASCGFGWNFKQKSGKDICQQNMGIGMITGNYTVPKGAGVIGNPVNAGWRLVRNHRGTRDYWKKTKYTYPVRH